ncbi:MAG: hypothetical protein JWR44_1133 [Hymenobacter sp.]|jgi:hypothetical protein|nr:hypothetical protein [Hymenobacter sp.]
MRFLYLLLSFGLLLSAPARAQFSRTFAEAGRKRDVEAQLLQSQPLLVMLKREDPRELKKLANKPAELQAYKEYIAFLNHTMQQLVAPVWTLSPKLEYKYEDEIEALAATNTGQLNVLEFDRLSFSTSLPEMRKASDFGKARLPGSYTSLLGFRLKIFVKKVEFNIHDEPVLTSTPHDSDLIYCLKMIEQFARTNNIVRAKPTAAPPMLLLCEEDRTPGLTDAQIKPVYPYPYQFVGRAEFEKAVHAAAPGIVFARMSWQGYGIISPMVFSLPGLELVCGGDFHSLKDPLITLKDFKMFKKSMPK